MRARVIERDGEVVAVAGYYVTNGWAAVFSDIKDETLPKLLIWREALKVMRDVKIKAFCVGDEKSGAFLQRLGWKFNNSGPDGDIYTWAV